VHCVNQESEMVPYASYLGTQEGLRWRSSAAALHLGWYQYCDLAQGRKASSDGVILSITNSAGEFDACGCLRGVVELRFGTFAWRHVYAIHTHQLCTQSSEKVDVEVDIS
jgi:hypothetical protein